MGLKLKTNPPAEPVTRGEMKNHLRVDLSDEDNLIDALNAAAREWVEEYTARQLVDAQYEWILPRFPGRAEVFTEDGVVWHTPGFVVGDDRPLYLPRAPVRSVEKIEYVDTDGNTQTFGKYQTDLDRVTTPPVIVPDPDETWPSTKVDRIDGVTVTFTAGYAPDTTASPTDYGANVPQRLKTAIKLLCGHWYENRQAVVRDASPSEVPFTVVRLIENLRVKVPA